MKKLHKTVLTATATLVLVAAAGCTSPPAAKKAAENLSVAADNFEVQRKIVGVNGITDKIAFQVEGRCSIDRQAGALITTCKHGPNDYRKHYLGLSDNTYYVAEQLGAIDVSVYHTRIIVRPETILPSLELDAGKQ